METYIYLHHGKHLSAIVLAAEGKKFIDNIERFCTNWMELIDQAKRGFDGYPFYDRYINNDVDFWDLYLEIHEGCNEDYELLGCINDGTITFASDDLANKGDYFAPLMLAMRIAERYDFHDIHEIDFTENYIVLSSDREVMACSKIKIPFEPNLEQKELRDLIRSKLKSMRPFGNQMLYARYGCQNSEFYDVENALFYNVGIASFSDAVGRETSVYFEKIKPNEICNFKDAEYRYVYHYVMSPKGKNKCWWEHDLVCEWKDIRLKKVNASSSATEYFLAIKNSLEAIHCYEDGSNTTLGLRIQLSIPRSANFANVLNVIKPMIDGVICAFHTPNGIEVDKVGKLLNINKEIFLMEEKTCLGKCRYIDPYRQVVKWNPQDDRLDYVIIDPVQVRDEEFSFSGQIYAVPCNM